MASLQRSKSDVPAKAPLGRRLLAGLVLAGVVVIGVDLLIHAVLAIFWVLVAVAVVAAVIWALKTIVW